MTQITVLETRRLSPAIGMEILGVDASRDIDARTAADLLATWEANGVILLRGQSLTSEQQIAFAEHFGAIGRSRRGPPPVLYVSNKRSTLSKPTILPAGEMDFHSDQAYLPNPPIGTMLYAIEVPAHGGDTLFANALAAADSLPDDLRARLSTLQAVHAYDYRNSPNRRPQAIGDDVAQAVHPVLRRHSPTGRDALFVSRHMTRSIVGLDDDESAALLFRLFDHQERPGFVYRHRWLPGDLLLWDNRSCLHARTDFDPSQPRELRRTTLLDPETA